MDVEFIYELLSNPDRLLSDQDLQRLCRLLKHPIRLSEWSAHPEKVGEHDKLKKIRDRNFNSRGEAKTPGLVSAKYGIGTRWRECLPRIRRRLGTGASLVVNLYDLKCDPAPNVPKRLELIFDNGEKVIVPENESINDALSTYCTPASPAPPLAESTLAEMEKSTPPLDRDGGQWITSKLAAQLDGLEPRTLASYRQRGISDAENTLGRDRDGRVWRRQGTRTSHPWYLRSTLKSAKQAKA